MHVAAVVGRRFRLPFPVEVTGVGGVEGLAQYTMRTVRPFWWLSLFIVISACALWIVVYSHWNFQDNPVASRIAYGYFVLLSVGGCWMLYDCWKHDKRFTDKMWLSFVPGGFLWYYFERFRPRQVRKQLYR